MSPFTLRVNDKERTVDVASNTPLLWVLRDTLGLTGTKYSCSLGLCGACMVHVDGRPSFSCQIPISSAEGADVTTIEGLSLDGAHPLQRAWAEEDVPQCGYCQAGQLMAAAALLSVVPEPGDAQIDAAMSGNLCRCGTYQRIRRAVRRAALMARED
jgi:aerobic-type carbon monoxide dehydrogenase small subunit (CoxS/CutS family)